MRVDYLIIILKSTIVATAMFTHTKKKSCVKNTEIKGLILLSQVYLSKSDSSYFRVSILKRKYVSIVNESNRCKRQLRPTKVGIAY